METNFIERLKAVLAKTQKKSFEDPKMPGLQVVRFTTNTELIKLLLTSPNAGLVFIAYQDQTGKSWFSVGQVAYKQQDRYPDAVEGTLIVVEQELFSGQNPRMITRLKQYLQMGEQIFQMDGSKLMEWRWVVEKIECTLSSDYAFRRAYLQELVVQVVHCALKQITLNKIGVDTYHPIKVVIDDEILSDEYVSAFNIALTISAN